MNQKINNSKKLSSDNLISLLSLYHTSEQNLSSSRLTQTAMFLGEIVIILGGSITVLQTMQESVIKYIIILFSGFLALVLSIICYIINNRTFRIQTEFMTRIGKIEDLLNFKSRQFYGKNYWTEDTLMINRYYNTRKFGKEDIENEEDEKQIKMHDYIEISMRNKGQLFAIKILFVVLMIFSSLIILYALQKEIPFIHILIINILKIIK